jgi:outer membrane lipoprotein-sorting protein
MKKIGLLIFVVFLVASAQTQSDIIWQKVRARYQKVNTAQGSFHQNVCSESLGTCQEFIGWFYLKRPDKLRLNVTFPDTQDIIVSGNKILFHFPAQSEISTQELPGKLSPFDIFSDSFPMAVAETRNEDNLVYLKLAARDTFALITGLDMWVNPKDYSIKKFAYSQGPGTVATFELYSTQFNKKISDNIFAVPAPKKEN